MEFPSDSVIVLYQPVDHVVGEREKHVVILGSSIAGHEFDLRVRVGFEIN
jgi:hypothetical protein